LREFWGGFKQTFTMLLPKDLPTGRDMGQFAGALCFWAVFAAAIFGGCAVIGR